MTKIITHPGPAHFDEFMAICLILAGNPDEFEIERRQPTEAELNNPEVWVIDIGGKHEPSMKNFDHHHDRNLDCSYVLVADYLGYKDLLKDIPWWRVKSDLDTKGPSYVIKEMDLTSEEFLSLGSPLEKFILEMFSYNPNKMLDLMSDFGRRNIANALKFKKQMDVYKKTETTLIKGHVVMIHKSTDMFACERYAESCDPKISMIISYDNRGDGWSITRFFDNPVIDLSVLEGLPEIKFAHKNGFVAKTYERIPLEKVFELIEKSIK